MALVPYSIPSLPERVEEIITTQFRDQPVIYKYLRLWSEELHELFVAFQQLAQDRDIDSATGDVLDIIGRIVGQERTILGADLYDFFGFRGHLQALGFGDTYVEGVGGRWWSLGAPMGGDVTLTDEQYRVIIKARIMRNNSRGTPEDMLDYIRFVFGVSGKFSWNEGGVARIGVGRKLTNFEKAIIASEFSFQKYPTYYSPKPLGVTLELFEYDSLGTLGFIGTPTAKGMITLSEPNPDGGVFGSIKYFEEIPANPPTYTWDSSKNKILPGFMGFKRASTATYWGSDGKIHTAAANTPRMVYHPESRVFEGMLLEESRTNVVLNSTDLSAASWSGMGMTTETQVTIDGTTVKGLAKTAAWQSRHQYCWLPIGAISGSFYVKNKSLAGDASFALLSVDGSDTLLQVVINTATGVPDIRTNSIGGVVNTMVVGGGVYVTFSATLTAEGVGFVLYPGDFSNDVPVTSFFSCPQLEVGAMPTSYIPTGSEAGVRAAESCVSTAISLPFDGFSAYIDCTKKSTIDGYPVMFSTSEAALGNYIGSRSGPTGLYVNSSEGQRTNVLPNTLPGERLRVAFCASNSVSLNRIAVNGEIAPERIITPGSVNLGARNRMKLGQITSAVTGSWLIHKFSVYTEPLSAEQLSYLTYAQS